MRSTSKSRGFTLPELVITLGVAAILLSLAVPSLNSTVKNNRIAGTLNHMIADIHYARGEAAKRGVRVILCRVTDPNAANPQCGGVAKNWTGGYIVYADDGNYTNQKYDSGTDVLLRRGQAAASGVHLRTNARWDNYLEFNPDGRTNEGGVTASMSVCDDRGSAKGRLIHVAPSGIPRMDANNLGTCSL